MAEKRDEGGAEDGGEIVCVKGGDREGIGRGGGGSSVTCHSCLSVLHFSPLRNVVDAWTSVW